MIPQKFKWLVLSLHCIWLPACWDHSQESSQGQLQGLLVINVLDEKLYQDCHIKGSINIPFDQIEEKAKNFDKNTEIILYCSNYMCSTSGYAAKKLKELGFEHVAVYEGGTAEWYQKGLPVEGPGKSAYLTKKIAKPSSSNSIPSIDAQTLAQKMGF